MLYPRQRQDGRLISDDQMVEYKEHMTQTYRVLFMRGMIGGMCPHCGTRETDSQNLLLALDTLSHDPIKLIIDSPGGDLDTTFLFVDTMKTMQSPIITIGRYCASAACLILASGAKRYLFPHAKTMLHLATGQMGGDYKDFAIQHKLMVDYQEKIIDILQDAGVKRSRGEILTDIDRQFWLEPEEAIAYGLADEIMTKEVLASWLPLAEEK